jgi:hypothetical protein
MSSSKIKRRSPLKKMVQRGFRGYPLATIAFYGPDLKRASKVAVAIMPNENTEPLALERWFSVERDVRNDPVITQKISEFIEAHKVKSVTMADQILGCPHEEGIDYPEGGTCSQCSFWSHRDRWTGETVH